MDLPPDSAPEDADTDREQSRVKILKRLIGDSLYVVDERAVADAIVLRALARHAAAQPPRR